MRSGKGWSIFCLLCLLLGGCCGSTLVSQETLWRGQEIRPYVGLVRNFAEVDIVLPSVNSDAAIVLPAQGTIEYTVWQPHFTLFGYVGGQEVYCRRIQVQPKKYNIFCKKYDFLAEIYPESANPRPVRPRWETKSEFAPPAPPRRPDKSASG